MNHRFRTVLIWLSLIVLAFCTVWMLKPDLLTTSNGAISIAGNTPAVIKQATRLAPADPNKPVDVVIGLKFRVSETDVDDLIAQQSDPTSPQFRKFLSPDEFTQRFAQSQADVDKLVAYVKTQGLTVSEVSPNRMLVRVLGTVAQIEKAFNVKIDDYSFASVTGISNDRDPTVPSWLGSIVGSIDLNTISKMQSRVAHKGAPVTKDTAPPTPTGLSPQQLATAYNFPTSNNPLYRGTQYNGRGVTLAIASAENYRSVDVEYYWAYYGIKRAGSVTNIYLGGRKSLTLEEETTLDVEQVGAQAPGADVLVYLVPNSDFSDFTSMFNRIITDNKAAAVSVSWGMCDHDVPKAQVATQHRIFMEAAVQGITWFSAAGDQGVYDCNGGSKLIDADYPAADPYVTAVGGTTLKLNADNTRASEEAWNGSGGAPSLTFTQPAWQTQTAVPGTMRNTSDVALNADPDTSASCFSGGYWDELGGTSFASPEWLGFWGQNLEAVGGRLGASGPLLYRMGRDKQYGQTFTDITVGANGNHMGAGYSAAVGWDYPTGWGVPNGLPFITWVYSDQLYSVNPSGFPLSSALPISGN